MRIKLAEKDKYTPEMIEQMTLEELKNVPVEDIADMDDPTLEAFNAAWERLEPIEDAPPGADLENKFLTGAKGDTLTLNTADGYYEVINDGQGNLLVNKVVYDIRRTQVGEGQSWDEVAAKLPKGQWDIVSSKETKRARRGSLQRGNPYTWKKSKRSGSGSK